MADVARRRQLLSSCNVCRFCLSGLQDSTLRDEASPPPDASPQPSAQLTDMFGAKGSPGAVPLPIQVMACVSIEVFPADGMPSTICNLCRHFMDQSYKFKQICKKADEALRNYVSQGDISGPISWPPDLIRNLPEHLKDAQTTQTSKEPESAETPKSKSPESKKKANKNAAPRPVGRPRKKQKVDSEENQLPIVTTMNVQEEDDDEEESISTKIKVTQFGDSVIILAEDDDHTVTDDDIFKGSVPTGVYPCSKCERSFPLQQLRDIHMDQHVREKTHGCTICDRKFYNKYDLQKHEETHSQDKPYECGICKKKFLRRTFMQRHLKVHTTALKYLCTHCDHIFLTPEELSKHVEERHNREKPFSCSVCDKRFVFKQGMERHFALNHCAEGPFKCEYCNEGFSTSGKLMRHIRVHAGQRPYPCKFCNKSFSLSHHYTRHLRTKHVNKGKTNSQKGRTEGVFAPQEDTYKCVQCEKTFCTQDELIFHSAVHATQDLTCPLCNEKFFNVDAVTTHIKSHIEGEQFVCECCELVFTSEDKLDMHIDSEHQELMSNDVFKEIQYLESKMKEEGENAEENSQGETDEEDELYESSQQAEVLEEECKMEGSSKEDEIEVEVDTSTGMLNLKIVSNNGSYDEQMEVPAEAVASDDDANKVTYTELKTVNNAEPSTKPTEIIYKDHKSAASNVDAAKKLLAASKDSGIKKTIAAGSSPKAVPTSVAKVVSTPPPKIVPTTSKRIDPPPKTLNPTNNPEIKSPPLPPRTSEKSLMLLEKEISELKRNAKPASQKITTHRFSPYRSILQRNNEERTKLLKTQKDTAVEPKEKTPAKSSPKTPSTSSSSKVKGATENKVSRMPKREKIITKEPSESSMSDDGDYTDEEELFDSKDVENVRRSSRPSKVKDYAALIRDGNDKSRGSDMENEEDDEDRLEDDELEEQEYRPPTAVSLKQKEKKELIPGKRGRGRPKKNATALAGFESPGVDAPGSSPKMDDGSLSKKKRGRPSNAFLKAQAEKLGVSVQDLKNKKKDSEEKPSPSPSEIRKVAFKPFAVKKDSVLSPSGHRLKMVAPDMIKLLPPGIKPLPLPPTVGSAITQMKIGEKVVRVQKIVMSKAEVDAIQKKGLIEMKDGAMVLKAGVRLPNSVDNDFMKKSLLMKTEEPKTFEEEIGSVSALGKGQTSRDESSATPDTSKDTAKPTRFADQSDEE